MYSIKTQKRAARSLYLLIFVILLAMPFRYIHLMLHDMSVVYLTAKYIVVSCLAFFLAVLLFVYFILTPKPERKFEYSSFRDIAVLAFVVAVMGVIVGIANGNQFYYLVGDTFRHVSPWIFFFVFLWMFQVLLDSGKVRVIERFLAIMAFVGVIEAISTFVMKYIQPDLRISTALYLWSIIWCLYQKKYPFILIMPILLVCSLASVASGKRTPIVLLSIIVGVYMIYLLRLIFVKNRDHKEFVHKSIEQFLVVFLLIILVISFLPVANIALNKAGDNYLVKTAYATVNNVYEIFSGKTEDKSWKGRWIELDNILAYMQTRPETWLWGAGFGSEIDQPENEKVVLTKEGKMHNVHQAWSAYIFRSGALGLILFVLFFAKVLWVFIRGGGQYLNWQYYTLTFVMFSIVASFSANVMLESFGDAFFCALLYSLTKNRYPVSPVMPVPVSMEPAAIEDPLNKMQDEFIEYDRMKSEQNDYASIR